MYSQGDIEDAVASGALAPEQASSFRAFVANRNHTPTADEEYYRVFRGFNDWYVTYTIVLTLVTVGWLGALIPLGGGSGRGMGGVPMLPFMAPLLVTGVCWGLAEIFTRRRRTALPSILLAITFALGALLSLIFMLAPTLDGGPGSVAIIGALCCAAAAGAAYGYWLRFRQPISHMLVAGLAALAFMALIGGLFAINTGGMDVFNVIAFLLGLAVFAYAMWWDGSDPWRVTERSETGLWLHGLAGALLVFPLIYFLGLRAGVGSVVGALGFLIIFTLFAFVAIAVNRKGYLLSAISPLIIALNTLLQGGRSRGLSGYDSYGGGYGGRGGMGMPNPMDAFGGTVVTLLLVSLIMLALAIWWAPLRRIVSGILPASLRARAPAEGVYTDVPPPYDAPPPPPPAY